MKPTLSDAVTLILKNLPSALKSVILRKAIAIADNRTRFRNWQVTMFGSLDNMQEAGFTPGGVVDIGANVGKWTEFAAKVFQDARFHLVEAQPALADDLGRISEKLRGRATFSICLLGAEAKEQVPFHVIGTGSSVFEEVTNLKKAVVTLPMMRLDDIEEVQALPEPIFLKLDVQGYELEVLKGASDTLARTEAVLMEVALLPYNKGAPLMPEVVSFMDEQGFTPYDICGQLRRVSDRALFQVDMIFVRKTSALREHRRFSMFEPTDEDRQN